MRVNRRQMIRGSGAAAVGMALGGRPPSPPTPLPKGERGGAAGDPRAVVRETKVISDQPQYYHGWPTLARRRNGHLLLCYSGGREGHVCPFGRVEMMQSADEGRTWSWPRVLLDSAIDDRDSGVLETSKGTILVTTFSSLGV